MATMRSVGVRAWGGSADEARALEEELRATVRGEVRFDGGSRALYATDASNYRQVPIGVVIPRDADDVIAAIAVCRRFGAPVLSRGGGTSLAGQTCNVAVVLDLSKYMNRVLAIDSERQVARVQPGTVLDDLRDAAEAHGLTFGPDPATHNRCTLGGMLGNNSCGVHSEMSGKTDENTLELEILTYDGLRLRVGPTSEDELARIIAEGGRRGGIYAGLRAIRDEYADLIRTRFPHLLRRVSGYNLEQLLPEHGFNVARALVGSEGTCVTILEASLRLVESPSVRTLLVLGYPDIYIACDAVPLIRTFHPTGLEGMDGQMVDDMRRKGQHLAELAGLPEGYGWLLVEFGGATTAEANEQAHRLMSALQHESCAPSMLLVDRPADVRAMWIVREAALGATALSPGEPQAWPGWEDSAVPPDVLGSYLRDLALLLDRFGYRYSFYGHFGQGCIHCRIDFDLITRDGIDAFAAFTADAADLVVAYGGSLSGEHGDGQARADLLPKMFGPELVEAFARFKAVWDPDNKMNPGKVVDPAPRTSDLRLGTTYNPAQPRTHFRFPQDNGSLAQATLRCVGVGKCRRHDGGTMCPSYMVTREEQHSTRGRARLLFEMLEGEVLHDGWRSEAVHDALDLCLACKGCKGECPVRVDMATYKAEFLSHYYAGRLRPRSAYAMGLIHRWARLAAHAPRVANLLTQTPGLRDVAKALGGIHPRRSIPAFAPRTFKQQFAERQQRIAAHPPALRNLSRHSAPPLVGEGVGGGVGGKRVILWPDTFNDHFHPETAMAAVEVLEAAGYTVVVPELPLCCGRPLYDFGFLDTAKGLLRQIVTTLADEIAAGTPIVGLEPSCVAVFRDELGNLFPNDENAKRLARQTFLLSEFLVREGYEPPRLARKAIVHGHCHHKAIMGMADEEALLSKMGLDVEVLDSGCCGMAGAFGFERDHYDVSLAVGERVLLPAVRAANADTLILADGFSCREQIAQTTERRALHLAELLAMAAGTTADHERNARAVAAGRSAAPHSRQGMRSWILLAVGAILAGSLLSWQWWRAHQK